MDNREIKVRAWDKKIMKFVNTGIQFNNTEMCLEYIPDLILMQFTGLEDKNGVEIFEGDVIERFIHKKFIPTKKEVIWEGYMWSPFDYMYHGDVKVIGNIYENPELLEKP